MDKKENNNKSGIRVIEEAFQSNAIDSKKALTAYLDILGYKNIVAHEPPEPFYKIINKIFDDIKEYRDRIFPTQIKSNKDIKNQCTARCFNAIKYYVLGDAIIICCSFEDTDRINSQYYEKNEYFDDVYNLFFCMVSTFVLRFTARTGHLLRGGVSEGQFCYKPFNHNFVKGDFLYSQSVVDAYQLERTAKCPRILVDRVVYNSWKEKIKNKNILLAKDKKDKFYLDYYEFTKTFDVGYKRYWFKDIKKQIKNNLKIRAKEKDKEKLKIWKKWYWFKGYHNCKMRTLALGKKQDLSEFLVN